MSSFAQILLVVWIYLFTSQLCGQETTKTEMFDCDPGWIGVNNRLARKQPPVTVKQDFGYSKTSHASGDEGELGGVVTPAGEVAYYGKVMRPVTLNEPLHASGVMAIGHGETHLLLGFFNADTTNEWRTPNTIAMRLNGRGDHFFAYVEYCTSQWRAGGDTTPFPTRTDPVTNRSSLIGFPSGRQMLPWTLTYDPRGNERKGVVTATIGDDMAVCNLDESHRADGATFNRFGILNVMKSADNGSEVYFDNMTIQGKTESFENDPNWDGKNNRQTWQSTLVRPRFDFGFSQTRFAGGIAPGELGGQIFRGDCRYPDRMASFGDKIGELTLGNPFKASGKIAMTRGVTDSTTLFGFYNARDSMRSNELQSDSVPASVVAIHIEGPSREGFCFYPVYRTKDGNSRVSNLRESIHIYPDGAVHDWSLAYNPDGADGKGQITVSLDSESGTFDLEVGAKTSGTQLDRFGIVTSWIDGNSQDVYWDDITYTVNP